MTKEELKQEAEEFTDSKKSFWRQGRTCIDSVKQAYIAGAEPREKRIEELEATNKTISNECHKLVDSLEKKQNEFAELKAVERMALYSRMSDRLAKAEELLERLLITSCNSDVLNQYPNCSEVLKVRCEAEQFLKEVSE